MLVRRNASHNPRPSVRCEETVQTTCACRRAGESSEDWSRPVGMLRADRREHDDVSHVGSPDRGYTLSLNDSGH
jgi:hypothetical protein